MLFFNFLKCHNDLENHFNELFAHLCVKKCEVKRKGNRKDKNPSFTIAKKKKKTDNPT